MDTSKQTRKRKREHTEKMGSSCCKAAEAELGTNTKISTRSPPKKQGKKYKPSKTQLESEEQRLQTPTEPGFLPEKKGKKNKPTKTQLESEVQRHQTPTEPGSLPEKKGKKNKATKTQLERLMHEQNEHTRATDDVNIQNEEKIKTLVKQLEEANKQNAEGEQKNKDLLKRLEDVKNEKEETAERNNDLAANLQEANKVNDEAEKRNKGLIKQLEDANKEKEELMERNVKQLQEAKNARDEAEKRSREDERKCEHLVKQLKDAAETNKDLERRITDLKKKLDAANEQNSNLLNRVSELAGAKLSAGNPNLVDISDENRPTKLAERYNELYDNDWTDAFDILTASGLNDETAINKLKHILLTVYEGCREFATEDLESFLKRFHYDENSTEAIVLRKQYIDRRKKMYTNFKADLKEKMENRLTAILSEQERSSLKHFIDETTDICLLMCLQDPLVVIESGDPGDAFDTSKYKAYTASGKIIDYIVWPALRLHKGGPLLGKGIAQGRKDKDLIEKKKGMQTRAEPTRPQTPPADYTVDTGVEVGTHTNQNTTERSDKNEKSKAQKDQRQVSKTVLISSSGKQFIEKNTGSSQQKKQAPSIPVGTATSNQVESPQASTGESKNKSVINVGKSTYI